MFYVYVLKSKNDYSQYIGLSQNLEERLEELNTVRVNSTKSKRPWQLIYTESFTTCLEARKREKIFKICCWKKIQKANYGRLAQLARALARQARGHWFKSSIAHIVKQGLMMSGRCVRCEIVNQIVN